MTLHVVTSIAAPSHQSFHVTHSPLSYTDHEWSGAFSTEGTCPR